MQGTRADEFDDDYLPDDDTPPYWFPGTQLTDEARRIGLTHHVPDGALLDFAGRLDPSRTYHRAAAWVMLAVFGLPAVFQAVRLVQELGIH